MRYKPLTGAALGRGDVRRAHLGGNFLAAAGSFHIPAQGGNVEPLVRFHQIRFHTTSASIADGKREEIEFRFN